LRLYFHPPLAKPLIWYYNIRNYNKKRDKSMNNEIISREDWKKLEGYEQVTEINFKVAEFHIFYNRAPDDLTVTIWKQSNGEYLGFSNYSYWGPKQATPYRSIRACKTVKDALDDVIRGIRSYDESEYPDDVVFWEKTDATPPILTDGTGRVVDNREARWRRGEYNKKRNKGGTEQ